jgi:phage-related holin
MKTLTIAYVLPSLLMGLILPPVDLLMLLTAAMVLDLITGVASAKLRGVQITSTGFRGTIKKFIQYGSAIAIGILLANLADRDHSEIATTIYKYFDNTLISFLIFIEIKSILENSVEISPTSDFTKYFLTPINKLLSLDLEKFTKTENEKS